MLGTSVLLIIEVVEQLVIFMVLLQVDISDALLVVEVTGQLKF